MLTVDLSNKFSVNKPTLSGKIAGSPNASTRLTHLSPLGTTRRGSSMGPIDTAGMTSPNFFGRPRQLLTLDGLCKPSSRELNNTTDLTTLGRKTVPNKLNFEYE